VEGWGFDFESRERGIEPTFGINWDGAKRFTLVAPINFNNPLATGDRQRKPIERLDQFSMRIWRVGFRRQVVHGRDNPCEKPTTLKS
jgi:hypothetical protein